MEVSYRRLSVNPLCYNERVVYTEGNKTKENDGEIHMLDKIKQFMKEYEPEPLGNQRDYAVLLPLIDLAGEIHVLYEVRSQTISQPGETSFPGGAVEKWETVEEAAIRETMEELNLSRENIEVYGEMDFIVNERQVIHCFVGKLLNVHPDNLIVNEEVDSVFTIPLSYLLTNEPEYHATSMRTEHDADFPFDLISNGDKFKWNRFKHYIPFYRLPGHYLWGYTANFTHRFTQMLQAADLFDH